MDHLRRERQHRPLKSSNIGRTQKKSFETENLIKIIFFIETDVVKCNITNAISNLIHFLEWLDRKKMLCYILVTRILLWC